MSNNINRSSLEQAKADFEEIRTFAQSQAEKKLQEEVDKKLLKIINEKLNEDVNISVDVEGNVAISKDGEEVASVNAAEDSSTTSSDIESDIDGAHDEDADGEFTVSDDEEPISVSDDEELDEMINNDELNNQTSMQNNDMKMEQDAIAAPAPAATTAPAPDASAPAPAIDASAPAPEGTPEEGGSDAAIESLVSKMDTLINLMMQQQGATGDQTAGQEFEVIDDENAGATAPAPEAGAPAPAPAAEVPVQEEMEFEITDFEEPNDSVLEIVDDMGSEDVEIVDEYEETNNGPAMEETRGLGFTSKRTGDKTLKMDVMQKNKGHHAPVTSLEENKKAQYESTIDELKKENNGLKSERKEFEEAFVQLREQFDEMQTFNGKLALVNKLLMNGGLSFDEKLKVCEQFDSADTIEEAQKIYKSIIKENNIKVNNVDSKIKSTTTHTAKPTTEAKPLYESDEARRMKQLAGLSKNSEE
jgi:hypothetical protein